MLSWQQTIVDSGVSSSLDSMKCERAWVEINLKALAHNVLQIKKLLSNKTDLMAIVKADAYGHGAVTVAKTVIKYGATWLGVATIPEGIELRSAGITNPILILGAVNTKEQFRTMAEWELQPTICSPKQALILAEALGPEKIPIHIKLDTGLSRLGTPWEEATDFIQLVRSLNNLSIASIYSHLAKADDLDPSMTLLQKKRFEKAIANLTPLLNGLQPRLHLANSAATLSDRSLHYDMVRVGLAIYGLYPAPHLSSVIDLQPVMEVKARVTQVKTIGANSGVSYGHRYVTKEPMRIAVIGIGYADGVPRNLSNKLEVLVQGQKVPQIGSITMDQMMININDIPDIQESQVVTLLGRQGDHVITADDWANSLDSISWEILCSFKRRLPRVTINN